MLGVVWLVSTRQTMELNKLGLNSFWPFTICFGNSEYEQLFCRDVARAKGVDNVYRALGLWSVCKSLSLSLWNLVATL